MQTNTNEKKKYNYVKELTKGIIKENPVLCLVLGTCPTLAVTTAASNAIGMGIAATIVLICSNAVISALRKVIPDKVRIPAYITIIAAFVTMVQMVVKAFAPAIDESLGIFLPLIVVNCIILGRAEMYASKNAVFPSILDGLGMGIGFTATLLLMGSIREILGNGTWFGMDLPGNLQIMIFLLPPGGFFVFGMLIALASKLSGKKPPKAGGCAHCPLKGSCSMITEGGKTCEEKAQVEVEASAKGGGEV
ncbi:MAG: electron transport complex subunit E [Ruminococcus sp.]|nr:electron transport complex subunit E [Ruminococcus sp.]